MSWLYPLWIIHLWLIEDCQGCTAIITKQQVIIDEVCETSFSAAKRGQESVNNVIITTGNQRCGAQTCDHSRRCTSVFLSLCCSDNCIATRRCLTVCHITAAPTTSPWKAVDCQHKQRCIVQNPLILADGSLAAQRLNSQFWLWPKSNVQSDVQLFFFFRLNIL